MIGNAELGERLSSCTTTELEEWFWFVAGLRAARLGEENGRAAGSWAVDGNTSDETKRALLAGIADGDPEVLDSMPRPSDVDGATGILTDLGLHPEGSDTDLSPVLEAYENAYDMAYWSEVERACAGVEA